MRIFSTIFVDLFAMIFFFFLIPISVFLMFRESRDTGCISASDEESKFAVDIAGVDGLERLCPLARRSRSTVTRGSDLEGEYNSPR